MRKICFISSLLCIALVSFSCEEKNGPEENPIDPTPDVTPTDWGNFQFKASLEGRDTDTKSILDAETYQAKFVKGDKVSLYWGKEGTAVATVSEVGETAIFTASIDSSDVYYAVSPASAEVPFVDGNFEFTVSKTQSGVFSKANFAIAKTSIDDSFLNFKNVCPVLRLVVNDDNITGATIRSIGGEVITGKVAASFGENGEVEVKTTPDDYSVGENPSREIHVSIDGSGTYYVALLPGVDYSKGLMIRFAKSSEFLPALMVERSVNMDRNDILDLGQVEKLIVKDYYINNQEEARLFKELLITEKECANTDSLSVIAKGWKINNTTIHFSEGTFDVVPEEGQDNFMSSFWYCHEPIYVNVVGAGADKTVISQGNTKGATDGHGFIQICDFLNINFKNLSVANTYRSTSKKGGAFHIGSRSAVVSFENCVFSNCNMINDGGGVIGMSEGGHLSLKSCKFTDNTAKFGGVIYATGISNIDIEDCEFTGNKGTGANGPSVLICWGNAFVKMNRCYFEGNFAADRAVINGQGSSVIFLNACTFKGNSNTQASKYASVVHAAGNLVGINNCTFYQNNLKDGSTPYNNSECISAVGNVIISNSTFYELYQVNRSVLTGLTVGKAGVIFNNIILNSWSTSVFYFSSAGYNFVSKGHNIYMNITDYRKDAAKIGIPTATGDLSGVAKDVLGNAKYDSAKRVYAWDGSLSSGVLEKASESEFEPAVKSLDAVLSNTVTGSVKSGDAFWAWLNEINATNIDQLGNARGNSWWPGSYQEK